MIELYRTIPSEEPITIRDGSKEYRAALREVRGRINRREFDFWVLGADRTDRAARRHRASYNVRRRVWGPNAWRAAQ